MSNAKNHGRDAHATHGQDARATSKARVLIFTGEGKGKTTAALGMAVRASGHGMKVCVIQFIKADTSVGEVGALGRAKNIELHQVGLGFVPEASKASEGLLSRHRAAAGAGLAKAREVLASGDYEMVIMDEVCVAVAKGLVAEADVIAAIEAAGVKTVVVLTGRGATENLIALADTVTEMRCVKHGFHKGIAAQKGVEL